MQFKLQPATTRPGRPARLPAWRRWLALALLALLAAPAWLAYDVEAHAAWHHHHEHETPCGDDAPPDCAALLIAQGQCLTAEVPATPVVVAQPVFLARAVVAVSPVSPPAHLLPFSCGPPAV